MVGWGHIVFSVDHVSVASCPHSISLLNGQILAKLTQVYHWEDTSISLGGGKVLIRF